MKGHSIAMRISACTAMRFTLEIGNYFPSPKPNQTTKNMTTIPRTAEYGSEVAKENLSIHTTLETTRRAMMGGKPREVELYHRTAGYVPAGSAMTYRHEHFGFTWNDGRASHGQSFKTIEEARARFDAIANLASGKWEA